MSTEQNTENGNGAPFVQPPHTCKTAYIPGEDGNGDRCGNCDWPGGGRTATGYCSRTCQEEAANLLTH